MLATVKTVAQRAAPMAPQALSARGMATEKQLMEKITSTKNIGKITASMKMVASSKFRGDEKRVINGRSFGKWVGNMFEPYSEIDNTAGTGYPDMSAKPNSGIIILSSDKGLCGGVNTSTGKAVKQTMAASGSAAGTQIFVVGDKGRSALQGTVGENITCTLNDCWSQGTNFSQVAEIVSEIQASAPDADGHYIFFNQFQSMISYQNSVTYCGAMQEPAEGEEMPLADYEVEPENRAEVMENFSQYALGCAMYGTMVENAASFQSSQMQAMENATKNSNEVVETLSLKYNKARQTKITTELCEIVAGAAALEG